MQWNKALLSISLSSRDHLFKPLSFFKCVRAQLSRCVKDYKGIATYALFNKTKIVESELRTLEYNHLSIY